MVVTPDQFPGLQFQGKQPEESFQFYFRQHWIRLLWPLLKLIGWNILIIGIGWIGLFGTGIGTPFARRSLLLLLCGAFLVAHLEFLVRVYKYFLYVIVVTDKKVHRIKKTLVSIDDHQTVHVWMLQEIHKTQRGLVQNIFGYGTISLEAQETLLRLHFIPHVRSIYNRLMSLREKGRITPGT